MEKNLIENFDVWRFGEQEACRFLKKQGCKILERNYATRSGEIDIIARSHSTVVFVEVKTRTSDRFAQPWESVAYKKRLKLKQAAKEYVRAHSNKTDDYRFDVISVVVNENMKANLEWIQNAF